MSIINRLNRLIREPFLWNISAAALIDALPPMTKTGRVMVIAPKGLGQQSLAGEPSLMSKLNCELLKLGINEAILMPENNKKPLTDNDIVIVPLPALLLPALSLKPAKTKGTINQNIWQTLRQYFPPEPIKDTNGEATSPQVLISHVSLLAIKKLDQGELIWQTNSNALEPSAWISELTQAKWQTLGVKMDEVECNYQNRIRLMRDITSYTPLHNLWVPAFDRKAIKCFWQTAMHGQKLLAVRYALSVALIKPQKTYDSKFPVVNLELK